MACVSRFLSLRVRIPHETSGSVGRKDDLLVHTNGEKTMPGPMENLVKSHYM